jgi:hypothetical protein
MITADCSQRRLLFWAPWRLGALVQPAQQARLVVRPAQWRACRRWSRSLRPRCLCRQDLAAAAAAAVAAD